MRLERMADRSVDNILKSIEDSKGRSLPRVIFALGIPQVGYETSTLLAEHFGNIDELGKANQETLSSIPTIGPKTSETIHTFFQQKSNQHVVERLTEKGINPKSGKRKPAEEPLAGMEFVVTGTLDRFTRQEAESAIRKLGGAVGSSITKKTDYLVVGTDPGSKLDKARAQSAGIITESQFLDLLEGKMYE
jgi:DNA ligase (NAD+)